MDDAVTQRQQGVVGQGTGTGEPEIDWVTRSGRTVRWGLALFVLANVAALSLDFYLNRQIVSQFTPMLDGALHVKQSVIKAHLWFREYLRHEDGIGLDDVMWHLDQAQTTVLDLLDGRQIHLLPFAGETDPQTRDHWSLMLEKIRKLQQKASLAIADRQTHDGSVDALAGFDEAVRDVISFGDLLEASLETRIHERLTWLQHLQMAAMGLFFVMVATGAWYIHRSFRQVSLEVHRRYRAERRLKLSRQSALAARDELKVAASAKDQLLGKIGHEVRTPINAIFGLATVIESTDLNDTQRSYLRMLESETHTLWRIVEDLLDLSKLESSQLRINLGVIDLRRILVDAVDLSVDEAESKGIQLDVDLPLEFPRAMIGDRIRLRQILLNLLNNAIKFTDSGWVVAGLRIAPLAEKRREVTIWVSDTGMGIPVEQRQHVFDPFSQADDSTTRRFGGTGLGLAICRELVTLMGGTIGFDSKPGGGTTFCVRLPMDLAEGTADIPPPRLDGQRLLVVDCNDELRRRTCQLLSDLGAVVQQVDSVTQAADALRRGGPGPFDAVIASDRVPRISLEKLLALIRSDERLKNIRIVLLRKNSASLSGFAARTAGTPLEIASPNRALELPLLLLGRPSPTVTGDASGTFGSDAPAFYSGLTTLLVDDHPVMQIAGRHMLEGIGCRVDSAQDGRSALRQWQAKRYDVIFLDWEMPDIDGLEVARQIRGGEPDPRRPRPYLVAITANATALDRQRCLEAGMDEYLSKPVTKEAFIRVLRHFADQSATH